MRVQYPLLSVTALAAYFFIGCTGEAPQMTNTGFVSSKGNRPPTVRSARIVPDPIVLTRPLTVQVDGEDADRNALSFKYKWFVNETPMQGSDKHELGPEKLKRGDRVAVEVTPFDGMVDGAPYRTQPIMIGNTPPVVASVLLEPTQVVPGDRLHARVDASDADNDNIRLIFRWWKNQSLLKEGEESEIETTGFGPKDIIRVEVTPHDESSKGLVVSSAPLLVGNSPPKIVSTPGMPTSREQFGYFVQAKDADGDSITYLLETAPPGMTIDKTTGQITWKIPADLTGTHRIRVVAEDGQGGSSFQEFELTLAPPPAAS
jgi:hypothetical protein